MSIVFKDLTAENWSEYENNILYSEFFFNEKIRQTREDFLEILSSDGAIGKIAFDEGQYIGNIIGTVSSDDDLGRNDVLYLYNFVVNPNYQGRGFGKMLLLEFIREGKNRGFKIIVGDFKANTSLHLARKFGAREIHTHKNWYDTGEEYVHCHLDLESFAVH